ncbi:hypothetical protein L208DRAFT_1371114 [Tricholoma matsutake]|nr:hypothetical protein L208DRAFT_1371114 [Tricholoma matsutake 945]
MQGKFRVSTTPNTCPVTPRNQQSNPIPCYQPTTPFSSLVCPETPSSTSVHSDNQQGKRKRTNKKENELPQSLTTIHI